jgi:hypothetical protein
MPWLLVVAKVGVDALLRIEHVWPVRVTRRARQYEEGAVAEALPPHRSKAPLIRASRDEAIQRISSMPDSTGSFVHRINDYWGRAKLGEAKSSLVLSDG